MMDQKTLSETLGEHKIFTRLMTAHTLPWSEDNSITGELLDFEYIFNQSGDKIISPAVKKNLTDGELGTTEFNKLCDVAYMMYNKRWSRLWEILTAEFNPIENYSMEETKTINYGKVDTNSGTDTNLRTGTDTHAETGTDSISRTGTDTHAESGSDSLVHGEKHTLSGSDSLQHGETHTQSGTDSLLHGEKHTLSGNDTFQHGEKHILSGQDSATDTRATENEVSAFNSGSYQDATKSTNSGGTTTTYGKTDTASGTDTTGYGKTDTASGMDQTTYGKTDTASGTDQTTYGKTDTASGTDQTSYGHTDTETRNMTDATTYGHTDTETRNMTDTLTHGHILTASGRDTETTLRSGNIGVTTSQQMAQSSIDLWKWNYFYDIFRDIDSVFTISTY